MGRPVGADGHRNCGNVKEVGGGVGQAAVGGDGDYRGGEVGDGLDGEAEGQRGGDAAAAAGSDEDGGCEEPGEPEHRFAARVG
jgi:hypothetical protein